MSGEPEPPGDSEVPRSARLYRRLLRLFFPPDVVRRNGAEMESVFLRIVERERQERGRRGVAIAWIRALADGMLHGWIRRVSSRGTTRLARRSGPDAPRARWVRPDLLVSDLVADLRFALRQILRHPGFAIVAVVSLAIGVGATSAVFNAARVAIFQPIPGAAAPERLVEVTQTNLTGTDSSNLSYQDFLDLRDQVEALETMAAFEFSVFSFSRGSEGERVTGMYATPEYFDVMGLAPALGRFFSPDEDRSGDPAPVVAVSHEFWQERLGGDADVVGRTVWINRVPLTIVGVAPEGFSGHLIAFQSDVYLPLNARTSVGGTPPQLLTDRMASDVMAVGLRAPDVSVGEADAQVKAVYARLAAAYPGSNASRSGAVATLAPVPAEATGAVRAFFGIIGAMVFLILCATCANVAGMLVARNSTRVREMAVRLALGSGRARLVRQLVTETVVIFLMGGTIGTALALWLLGAVPVDRLPLPVPVSLDLSPDHAVLPFALAITLGTGLVFGFIPALQATRMDLSAAMKSQGWTRSAVGRLRRIFVTGQIAFSVVLLVSAGLLLRALDRTAGIDTGFDPAGVVMTQVDLEMEGYGEEEGTAFQRALIDRLEAIPGLASVALAGDLPLDLSQRTTLVEPEGWTGPTGSTRMLADYNQVSPDYFRTLRIAVLGGRAFKAADTRGREEVAIVSRTFADRAWGGEDVLGRRVQVFRGLDAGFGGSRTVVGIVEDVKSQLITDSPMPAVYLPLDQQYRAETYVVGRVAGSAPTAPEVAAMAAPVRDAILELDGSLSMGPFTVLESYTRLGVLPQQVAAGLTTSLGLLAVFLAALGIYGVVASAVAQRTREIGVRMAFGARRASVEWLVVRDGLLLAIPGLLLGAVGAAVAGYFLRFLLLGLSPADPVSVLGVAFGTLLVISAASFIPGRRAATIEPMRALGSE